MLIMLLYYVYVIATLKVVACLEESDLVFSQREAIHSIDPSGMARQLLSVLALGLLILYLITIFGYTSTAARKKRSMDNTVDGIDNGWSIIFISNFLTSHFLVYSRGFQILVKYNKVPREQRSFESHPHSVKINTNLCAFRSCHR